MSESPVKAATSSASPKSSPSKKEIDTATQALNHFAQGKRHLVVGDITSSVNSLQEACRLLAEQYGETAPECGDAYFYYGRALLEMARMENGVLGNALDGEEGSTEDEDEGDEEGEGESQDDEAEGDGEGEGEGGEGESQEEGEGESQEEGEKTAEDEEEVSNLQLSWEMLELAKVIFQKQEEGNPDMSKKVAQVYLKLGEVGLESENYTQAIEDFKQCLQIQISVMEDDNRCLAETHYQLGVAHSFSDDFDKSIESFKAAVKVIDMRNENLLKKKKEKEGWSIEQREKEAAVKPDPFYTEQGEIDELNQLLPEIKEKITDMEEMKKDSKDRLQKAAKQTTEQVEAFMANAIGGTSKKPGSTSQTGFDAPSTQTGFDAPSSSGDKSAATVAKTSTITHLVRKKRKPEEEPESDIKKAKGANGEAVTTNGTNGTTENGHSKKETTEEPKKETTEKAKKETTEDTKMETEEKASGEVETDELKKKAAEDLKKKTEELTGKTTGKATETA